MNTKKYMLSIIIPIYNVEDYLEECLESILNIKYDNFEVLLIDDGSTDKSGEIANNYKKRIKNCRCFHKKNGGLSDARNYGLKYAFGKYVYFMDSDDFIEPVLFELILNTLEDKTADVVLFDANEVDENGKIIDNNFYYIHKGLNAYELYNGHQVIEKQLLDHSDFVTTVWLGIYNREYLLENNFWFEKELIHEDELWTPKVIIESSTVIYLDVRAYNYRRRKNSIMNSGMIKINKNIESIIYIFSSLYFYYNYKITDEKLLMLIKANLSKRYLHIITKYDIYKYKSSNKIAKWIIYKNSIGFVDRFRALILLINGKLYCLVSKLIYK